MPALSMRRWGLEGVLALFAGMVFLGFLGSVELWGKREQRAAAEALDTVDHGHWLVARIQGRPRLEKPPVPRWAVAALMQMTGRRDELIVRLPSALAAIGMVGLVYALGRRLGGRAVGLSAGLVLTSFAFFVSEMRQAGNDGPLAFFTTLALYAAWRRLHGDELATAAAANDSPAGGRIWNLVFYLALALGCLTKGPIILVLVAMTVLPYLAVVRRLREGSRRLFDGWGLLLFLVLVASWPLLVLLRDPNAARVWWLEMGQKTGMAGITHQRQRELLVSEWPLFTGPWIVLTSLALVLPFLRSGRSQRPWIWFPWFWTVGNLLMFCFWAVAKPNYFLPCVPGAAILGGVGWVQVSRWARSAGGPGVFARRLLQAHWVVPFVAAAIAPVVAGQMIPDQLGWVLLLSGLVLVSVVVSAWAWRRGSDAGALASLVGAWSVGMLVLFGAIAPTLNDTRSHRDLAVKLERLLPQASKTVMFYQELDEGLWFYLGDRTLLPVPGTQPRYNKGFDLVDDLRSGQHENDPRKRSQADRELLLTWFRSPDRPTSYVLIRKRLYTAMAGTLKGLATPVLAEEGLARNELVLLRADLPAAIAVNPGVGSERR